MSQEELRYAIIGAGLMGLEHLRNLELVDGSRVVAIVDPDAERRALARAAAGGEMAILPSVEQLLSAVEVDVSIVATPNHTHIEVLEPLWNSGQHLLVEKPLCTTLEDCRRVADRAERHAGVVWVGMEYRYMKPIERLIEIARSGELGELYMISIREHRFPFLPKVGDWNRFNRNTGGTLVEKCCHHFDLMRQIAGREPVRVYASGAQDVNHLDERYDGEVPDILDNAFVLVDFEGGVRALLDLCMFAEGSRNQEELAVTGARGKAECFIPESTLVIGRRQPRQVETMAIEVDPRALTAGHHHGATFYQHRSLAAAIREGRRADVDVDDGLRAVAIGLAAQRSIEECRPVAMAELGL